LATQASWELASLQKMTEYFRKLNIDLSDLNLEDMNSGIVLHNPRGLDFTYYQLKDEYINVLSDRLPDSYKSKIKIIAYVVVGGPYTFHPHRDKQGVCAINYYIKTGPGETSFYEFCSEPKFAVIDNVEYEGWYSYDCLSKTTSFVANTNDCYMLKVSSIHDLKLLTSDKRHFIQFIFDEQI